MTCKTCTPDSVGIVEAVVPVTNVKPASSVVTLINRVDENVTNTLGSGNNTSTPIALSHCPTNQIKYIGKVGNEVIVTMDDCTYYKTKISKVDIGSFANVSKVITNATVDGQNLEFTLHDQVTGEETILEVTPPKASTTQFGSVKFATDVQVREGTAENVVVTPAQLTILSNKILGSIIEPPKASTSAYGLVKIAKNGVTPPVTELANTVPNISVTEAMINSAINTLKNELDDEKAKAKKNTLTLLGNDGRTILGKMIKES